jgi:hypothetical protein
MDVVAVLMLIPVITISRILFSGSVPVTVSVTGVFWVAETVTGEVVGGFCTTLNVILPVQGFEEAGAGSPKVKANESDTGLVDAAEEAEGT